MRLYRTDKGPKTLLYRTDFTPRHGPYRTDKVALSVRHCAISGPYRGYVGLTYVLLPLQMLQSMEEALATFSWDGVQPQQGEQEEAPNALK